MPPDVTPDFGAEIERAWEILGRLTRCRRATSPRTLVAGVPAQVIRAL